MLTVPFCQRIGWAQSQADLSIQTKIIRILMNLKLQPGEDPEAFVRRRNHAAACEARQQGLWSDLWRRRVIDWSEHCGRARNQNSWASKALQYHGKAWLQEQRRLHVVGEFSSLTAGRTCTRSFPGIVHKRWHHELTQQCRCRLFRNVC